MHILRAGIPITVEKAMTGDDLRVILRELHWSGGELSRRLRVHRNTVSDWLTDKRGVPGYVIEYLRGMVLAKRMLEGD